MQQRIFSGIQPSGSVHVGNYLGAIRNWVTLQEQYESIFCIVDSHAITVPYDPRELPERTLDMAATLMAAGLDPERCTLFVQSMVPEHTELAWYFTCITPLGLLERMTQYKEKAARQEQESVGAGLLCYPVLQAADILVYKAQKVPVGDDQLQHLELTRDIARKFNHLFGPTFPEAEAMVTQTPRVMALTDPTSKMSKSIPGGAVAIADEPDTIRKIVRRAVTDTGPGEPGVMSPGVKNLFVLLEAFGSSETYDRLISDYESGSLRYVDLKDAVSEAIIAVFTPIRERRAELLGAPKELQEILASGAERARAIARETIKEVKERMGLHIQSTGVVGS